MTFEVKPTEIRHKLNSVAEMVSIIERDLPIPVLSPHDIIHSLKEIKITNSYLSPARFKKIGDVLMCFSEILRFFKSQVDEETGESPFPNLLKDTATLEAFPQLYSLIDGKINKFEELKDTASPRLYEIRQSIKSATGSMQRAMRRVIDSAVASGIIDKDTSASIRDGRLVLPVPAGSKRAVSGIVYDESASGKTVFIEPAAVVEASNRLRELQMDEKREEIQILIGMADEVRPHINEIISSCYILGLLDFINAKAKLAITLHASLPVISDSPELEWYGAQHPTLMLALRDQGRSVVPLTIHLHGERRILIISGPNAGGKSVCLKTVAIVQYMMQSGLLPTLHDNSHMGVFKNVMIDIGDEQSIENDLSTYSSHLSNMRYFLQHSNKDTLLMVDEMGSGTEPQIGGAMAQAILEKLGQKNCFGVITTHYQNLKTFAENTSGFINGAMLYDRAHLAPTFQLSIGNPGSSFAIDIAHKMGLPRDVIEKAKEIVGSDYVNLDKYLSDIARDRKYWANKRLNIKEKEAKLDSLLERYEDVAGDLKAKRRELIDEARKQAQEILQGANAKIERTILEIRKVQAEKEKTKQLRAELKAFEEQTSKATPAEKDDSIKKLRHKSRQKTKAQPIAEKSSEKIEKPKPIEVGSYVQLDGKGTPGEVMAIKGKQAEVAFGAMRTFVNLSRLTSASKPKASGLTNPSTISASTSSDSRARQLAFRNEIDVRGMRADEALQAVTYYLDDAIQFNAGKVRILHGTGHGILKTLIRQQLNCISGIKDFYDEDIRFGGAGITIVDLE